ncbi:MAG: formate dehydrogenase subunit gamma [Nitrospirae bacterium]|nr:MAG: formate dehydrogenase subunit gamma [Nitrospirota bacterium]
MSGHIVQRTKAWERFNHWVLALSFIVLALTGLGFLYQSLAWLNTVFGGVQLAKDIHKWAGVVFAVSVFFTLFSYLVESLRWTGDDSRWLATLGGYFSKSAEDIPQGRLNAGQKLYYLIVVLLGGAAISLSGFLIWLGSTDAGLLRFAHFLHNLATFIFLFSVPLHIYLGTAANPGTFRAMTRGTVTRAWAKKHHAKWAKELGIE